jgi:NADPH:quinone reductase-like Zn-dependent oxidoreductase
MQAITQDRYPLSQAPEAIQYLRDGRAQGKVVISR